MKVLRFLATLALVLAGIALLWAPASGQTSAAKAFTPTRFTVVDEGTVGKPDVVLIPGLTSSREVWAGEAAKLAPNYRLHLVQIDGFAGQPAGPNATGPILEPVVTELHEYIEASGMRPVVIGHSLGGLLTLMLADKYPQDVRKMVIVDSLPFYGLVFAPNATVAMLQPQAAAMRDGLIASTPEQREAGAKAAAEMLVASPAGRELVEKNSEASDGSVFARAMYEDLQTDLRGEIASIKTPTLVLYEHDTTLQQPDAATYEKTMLDAYKPMPDVKLVQVDGARHFIMLDQPEKLDGAVEAFLK